MDEAQQVPNQNPITPVPPIATYPTPQSTPTNKTSWILISLIVALLGVASYFGYQNYQLKQQITIQQSTPSPSAMVVSNPLPTTTPVASTIPKEDWKTYTNADYSFSFKYPSTSTVKNNNYTGYLATYIVNKISTIDPNSDITFYIGTTDQSIGTDKQYIKPTTIAGIDGIRVSIPILPMAQNPPSESVYFKNNGKYYYFQLYWTAKDQQALDTFNQILSSFKFTK